MSLQAKAEDAICQHGKEKMACGMFHVWKTPRKTP